VLAQVPRRLGFPRELGIFFSGTFLRARPGPGVVAGPGPAEL